MCIDHPTPRTAFLHVKHEKHFAGGKTITAARAPAPEPYGSQWCPGGKELMSESAVSPGIIRYIIL